MYWDHMSSVPSWPSGSSSKMMSNVSCSVSIDSTVACTQPVILPTLSASMQTSTRSPGLTYSRHFCCLILISLSSRSDIWNRLCPCKLASGAKHQVIASMKFGSKRLFLSSSMNSWMKASRTPAQTRRYYFRKTSYGYEVDHLRCCRLSVPSRAFW